MKLLGSWLAAVFYVFGGLFFLVALTFWSGSILWFSLLLLGAGFLFNRGCDYKDCPWCAERVKIEAKKRRHCGSEFPQAV